MTTPAPEKSPHPKMRASWPRRIAMVMGVLVVVLVVCAFAAFQYLFIRPLPAPSGEFKLAGLSAGVNVIKDQHSVPHIFAANLQDAMQTLGYLHASERLFQMEMNRRAGQGRLAEVIGNDGLNIDKFTRTLRLYHLAEASYQTYAPETKAIFQAYANGVNEWLAQHQGNLPAEFLLLGIKPEPWQPADSVVWGKLMAVQLSKNMPQEKMRARLQGKIDPKILNAIFPGISYDDPVTTQPRQLQKAEANTVYDQLGRITGLAHGASNEWAIGGALTQSGKPIIANDPHLGLEAPILWYLARIILPDNEIKGATIPGLPAVLLGQNKDIAWGMTTTGSDVQDLFVETLEQCDPARYVTADGVQRFATFDETIKVKGGDAVKMTVRWAARGPVLSDIQPELQQLAGACKVMSLAFTGLRDDDRTGESLLLINQAKDWNSFNLALNNYQSPPQNMIYGDREGNIGFVAAGMVPVRRHGSGQGLMPAIGATAANDWVGYVPPSEWPRRFNPDANYIFNANNAITGPGGFYWYGADYEEPYRARRLQELLDQGGKHDLDRSAALQADHFSPVAHDLMPYLLKTTPSNDLQKQAIELLSRWDFMMLAARPEPLIFEAWLYQLGLVLLDGKLGDALEEKGALKASIVINLLANPVEEICAPQAVACATEMQQALDQALQMLSKRQGNDLTAWRWGREHRAQLTHKVYSHVPLLKKLTDLSVPSNGGFYTLDRGGSFVMKEPEPFARSNGGGYRAIYDLADPDQSRFMITTGQSGHIFSPHYGDLVTPWNDVKYINLAGSIADLQSKGGQKLSFRQ